MLCRSIKKIGFYSFVVAGKVWNIPFARRTALGTAGENLTPSPKVSLHTQHLLHLHPHSVSRLKEKDFTCFVENFPTFPRQFQTLSHHPIVLECENEMRKCFFLLQFCYNEKAEIKSINHFANIMYCVKLLRIFC